MNKKRRTKEFNKMDLLPKNEDGFIDLDLVEDDSDYSNLPEVKVLDPELYNLFSNRKIVEPSEAVEKKVMDFYRKEYAEQIANYKKRFESKE